MFVYFKVPGLLLRYLIMTVAAKNNIYFFLKKQYVKLIKITIIDFIFLFIQKDFIPIPLWEKLEN